MGLASCYVGELSILDCCLLNVGLLSFDGWHEESIVRVSNQEALRMLLTGQCKVSWIPSLGRVQVAFGPGFEHAAMERH